MCSVSTCAKTLCAFGTDSDFLLVINDVIQKTNNCSQPPLTCTPLMARYALAGVHGTCGQNELTRRMIEQVCSVTAQPLLCNSMPSSSDPGLLIAFLAIAIVFLTTRALKR